VIDKKSLIKLEFDNLYCYRSNIEMQGTSEITLRPPKEIPIKNVLFCCGYAAMGNIIE